MGESVVISGVNCRNPGQDTYLYFHSDFSANEYGADSKPPLGEVPTAKNGTFRVSYEIPIELDPYQQQGGGPVRPGKYGFGTKPPYCETAFEVIA